VRDVVELVACGEPLALALVEHEPGLEQAERVQLVEVVREGRRSLVRLAHPLYGEVLRGAMRPIRSRQVHRDLAERLGALPLRRRDDLLRLARLQVDAGMPADPAVLVPAARLAAARYDLVLAERLARRAADSGDPAAVGLLADVLYWRGRHGDSASLLAAGPPTGAGAQTRARWLTVQAKNLFWGFGRRTEAVRALDSVPRVAGEDGAADAVKVMMLLHDGRVDEAYARAAPICAAGALPAEPRMWAYAAAVSSCALRGRTAEALRLAGVGLELAERHRDVPLPGRPYLLMSHGTALLLAGRLGQARRAVERGYQDTLAVGDLGLVAQWAALRGLLARLRGDLPAAVASVREAVSLTEQQDPLRLRRFYRMLLAGVLAHTGTPEAGDWLRRADALAGDVPRIHAPQAELSRAWVAASAGETGRAADLAMRGARLARDAGLLAVEALALHDAARHGAARRVRTRLAELAAVLDGDLVVAYAESAVALADGDGPRLERIAARFADLDAALLAAEAMAAAARALRAAGAVEHAVRARERAVALAGRCPQARTPGLILGIRTDVLTPRERHVAALAAARMSSPDISVRLGISVRTVDNHLGRIYGKLGVTCRQELAALLHRDEPDGSGRQPAEYPDTQPAVATRPAWWLTRDPL
jgi:DNA-binding CsgD family transcriptional regulator